MAVQNIEHEIAQVAISSLTPSPFQVRTEMPEEKIEDLARSIRSTRGLLQPILVRPCKDGYQIIAGERRWRAAQKAGLKEVPVIIRDVPDTETQVMALTENLQREDLNPIERARGLVALKEAMGTTWREVARRLGLTTNYVQHLIQMLSLDERLQRLVAENVLPIRAAIRIASLPPGKQEDVLETAKRRAPFPREIASLAAQRAKELKTATPKARRAAYPSDLHRRLDPLKVFLDTSHAWPHQLTAEERRECVARLEALEESIRTLKAILQRAQP